MKRSQGRFFWTCGVKKPAVFGGSGGDMPAKAFIYREEKGVGILKKELTAKSSQVQEKNCSP